MSLALADILPPLLLCGEKQTDAAARQRSGVGLFSSRLSCPLAPHSPSAPPRAAVAAHGTASLSVVGALAGAGGEAVVQRIAQGF